MPLIEKTRLLRPLASVVWFFILEISILLYASGPQFCLLCHIASNAAILIR